MSDKGGEFFFGFVIGALAGAAAALLMAPTSGEETRQKLDEKRIELRSQAQKLAEEAKGQAQQLSDEARGQVTHLQERGRIVLSDNVKKAQQAIQEAQSKLGKPAEEVA